MDLGFIFALIARLPDDSMTRALQQGGDEEWGLFMGASREFYALAGIYDAVNTNTAATGWWKKPPQFDRYPTPDVVREKRKKENRRGFFDLFANIPVQSRESLGDV